MTVLAIGWVVLTPYCTGVIVGSWGRANRLVAKHLAAATALGWTALVVLLGAVFAVGGGVGAVTAAAVAPLVGLAFWAPGPRGNGGNRPASPEPPKPPARRVEPSRSGESSHHRRHHARRRVARERRVH